MVSSNNHNDHGGTHTMLITLWLLWWLATASMTIKLCYTS